jgi:hypothetical protein
MATCPDPVTGAAMRAHLASNGACYPWPAPRNRCNNISPRYCGTGSQIPQAYLHVTLRLLRTVVSGRPPYRVGLHVGMTDDLQPVDYSRAVGPGQRAGGEPVGGPRGYRALRSRRRRHQHLHRSPDSRPVPQRDGRPSTPLPSLRFSPTRSSAVRRCCWRCGRPGHRPSSASSDWLGFGPRRLTSARVAWLSLLFPACWIAFTLIRGAVWHWYPYPFIDVTVLGYGKVILNCFWVALLLLGLAAGATVLDRRLAGPAAGPTPLSAA